MPNMLNAVADMAADADLAERVRVAAAVHQLPDVEAWVAGRMLRIADAPGWADVWQQTAAEQPGRDHTVISDAQILSRVAEVAAADDPQFVPGQWPGDGQPAEGGLWLGSELAADRFLRGRSIASVGILTRRMDAQQWVNAHRYALVISCVRVWQECADDYAEYGWPLGLIPELVEPLSSVGTILTQEGLFDGPLDGWGAGMGTTWDVAAMALSEGLHWRVAAAAADHVPDPELWAENNRWRVPLAVDYDVDPPIDWANRWNWEHRSQPGWWDMDFGADPAVITDAMIRARVAEMLDAAQ